MTDTALTTPSLNEETKAALTTTLEKLPPIPSGNPPKWMLVVCAGVAIVGGGTFVEGVFALPFGPWLLLGGSVLFFGDLLRRMRMRNRRIAQTKKEIHNVLKAHHIDDDEMCNDVLKGFVAVANNADKAEFEALQKWGLQRPNAPDASKQLSP